MRRMRRSTLWALWVLWVLAPCLWGWDHAQHLQAVEASQDSLLEGDRVLAAASLRELGVLLPSARLQKAFRRALADRSGAVVAAAIQSAAELGVFELEPELIRALSHADAAARVAAARALSGMGLADDAVIGALQAHIADPSPLVRQAVVEALSGLGAVEAAPVLVGALSDPDPTVGLAAITALTPWCGEPTVLPALLERAREGTWDMRAASIEALGRSGDLRATPTLLRIVRDEQPDLRRVALSALTVARDPIAAAALLTMLRPDARDSAFIGQVLFALGQLGDPLAVEPLLDWAQGKRTWRPIALSALSALGTPAVEPVLRRLLTAPNEAVQHDLIGLLGRLPSPQTQAWLAEALTESAYPLPWLLDAALGLPATPSLLDAIALRLPLIADDRLSALLVAYRPWLTSRWLPLLSQRVLDAPSLRLPFVLWLSHPQAPSVAADATAQMLILSAISSDSLALRSAGIDAAARQRLDGAVEALGELSLAGVNAQSRAVMSAFARIGSGAAIEALVAVAQESDHPLASLAFSALSEALRGDTRADPLGERAVLAALEAMEDPASLAGDTAVWVLARLKAPELQEHWELWWSQALPGRRVEMLRALSGVPGTPSPKTLAQALEQALSAGDPRLRAEAAWLIGQTADPARWREALVSALYDPSAAVRVNAAASLGRLGPDEAARVALRRLLWSDDPMLQANAIWALGQTQEGLNGLPPRQVALLRGRAVHPFAQETLARVLDPAGDQASTQSPDTAGTADTTDEDAVFFLELWPSEQSPRAHIDAPVALYLPDGTVRATFSDAHGWVRVELDRPGRVRASVGLATVTPQ